MKEQQQYPIKIKVHRKALDELNGSEYGSYEDMLWMKPEDWKKEGKPSALEKHPAQVAERHKSFLEIRDAEEAEEMYYAVCSGTFQRSHYRTACRIADILRPVVAETAPDVVKVWKAPYGG